MLSRRMVGNHPKESWVDSRPNAAHITNYILLINFSPAVSSAVYYAKHFLSVAEVMGPNNSYFPFHTTPDTLGNIKPVGATAEGSGTGLVSLDGCSRDFAVEHIREISLPVSVCSAVTLIQMAAVQHSAASSNKPPCRQMKQALRCGWLQNQIWMQQKSNLR